MNARSFILLPVAIGSFGFTSPHHVPAGKLEMKLNFPFLQKKFQACKDSSLTARIVIINKTDTVVSFSKRELEEHLTFEVVTTTTRFTIERKEEKNEDALAVLFPGDSLVIYSLLVSSPCQLNDFTRKVPKPKQGLKSIRAIYVAEKINEEDLTMNTSYEERQPAQPKTSPDYNHQRNAVRRSEGETAFEVRRSMFKGSLTSNSFQF
jgi:hypothetical protein